MNKVLIGGRTFNIIKLRTDADYPGQPIGPELILKNTANGWKITTSNERGSYRWTRDDVWAKEPVHYQDQEHFSTLELEKAVRDASSTPL